MIPTHALGDLTPDPPADWTPITVRMPPEGVIVDTVSSGGRLLRVKWEGRVWRLPGGAHHPCFTPEYWRPAVGPVGQPVALGDVTIQRPRS
jgi:hypothetical protein